MSGAAAGQSEEINGLGSPAIDISTPIPLADNRYAAAFVTMTANGRPGGITVQSRNANTNQAWVNCTTTLPLPGFGNQVSHPALSRSGWLFVSANVDPNGGPNGWRLFATRRTSSLFDSYRGFCAGWDNGWTDLGSNGTRPVGSAPDAVVVDTNTYVFVTGRGGPINYLAFNGTRWSRWQSLRAAESLPSASKPAVATYSDGEATSVHIFWHASRAQIAHVAAVPLVNSRGEPVLIESRGPTARDFGNARTRPNPVVRPITACSAGPEIVAPEPLFVVCGSSPGYYYIARLRDPNMPWASDRAIESIHGDAWIRRSGGQGAPSLGESGLRTLPLMFVTHVQRYCPEAPPVAPPNPRPVLPCPQASGPWAIQRRWGAQMAQLLNNGLAGWQGAERLPIPLTASELYAPDPRPR